MPKRWTNKEERQYEHIKEGAKKRGKTTARAKEIAARTVNKQRQKQARTGNKTPQGTGNPRKPLEERTRDELYNKAKQMDIAGRSKMNKQQLTRAIEERS
jgi:plasmid stabilization system protein ParE